MRANLTQEIPYFPRKTRRRVQEIGWFPTGDVSSPLEIRIPPAADVLASSNCGICDTPVEISSDLSDVSV
jgi:hypothetical protein